MIEIGYTILLLTPLNDFVGWKVLDYGNRSILVIFCWTAITVVQIGTSPEMRRFLNEAKVDVSPNSMNNLSQLLQALNLETEDAVDHGKPNNANDMEMVSLD